MDDNTAKVIVALLALVGTIVTPLIVILGNRVQMKKLNTMEGKVEEYHKSVNGNMEKLLKTTKKLATAKEKARVEGTNKKAIKK